MNQNLYSLADAVNTDFGVHEITKEDRERAERKCMWAGFEDAGSPQTAADYAACGDDDAQQPITAAAPLVWYFGGMGLLGAALLLWHFVSR